MASSRRLQLNVPPDSQPPVCSTTILGYGTIPTSGYQATLGLFQWLRVTNVGRRHFFLILKPRDGVATSGLSFFVYPNDVVTIEAPPGFDTALVWDLTTGVSLLPLAIPLWATTTPSVANTFGNFGYLHLCSSSTPFAIESQGQATMPWEVLLNTTMTFAATGTLSAAVDTTGLEAVIVFFEPISNTGTLQFFALVHDGVQNYVQVASSATQVTTASFAMTLSVLPGSGTPLTNALLVQVTLSAGGAATVNVRAVGR